MRRLTVFLTLSILLLTGVPAGAQGISMLTLQQAVDTALQNLPEVREAQGIVRAAEAQVGYVHSLYYPDIHMLAQDLYGSNKSTSASYISMPGIPKTSGSTLEPSNNFLGGLIVNQVLYDFGRRSWTLDASESQSQAAGLGLAATRLDAILTVKQAYFGVLAAQRLISVNQAAVNRRGKILEMVQKGYDIGLRPKIDVVTAKTNLSEAQIALIRAIGDLQNAKAALDHAMGVENPVPYELEDILNYQEVPGTLEDFLGRAYQERPDLQETLHQEEASKKEVEAVKSDYFPFVTASASVNALGSDVPLTTNWNVALILDVPINWYRVRHEVSEARARLEQGNARVRGARDRVTLDVEGAYNDLNSAKNGVPAAQQSLDAAKERLEIADGRYKVGEGNIIELTDAQTFLTSADAEYVRALYDYNRAASRLERAIGGPLTK